MTLVFVLIAAWVAATVVGPFPSWPSFARLVRTVLFARQPGLPIGVRAKHLLILLGHALCAGVWNALWWLDELLYPASRVVEPRAVFITGHPRSGSTLLHRLLAADEQTFTAIRLYEWRYPFICLQRLLTVTGLIERLRDRAYWPDTESGNKSNRMHTVTLGSYEEDGSLLEERLFAHFYIVLRFPYAALARDFGHFDSYSPREQRRIVAVRKRAIQKIMYLRGQGRAFLSKEVMSPGQQLPAMRRFEDWACIVSLRPAESCVSSVMEKCRVAIAANSGVDMDHIAGLTPAIRERMRTHAEDIRAMIRDGHGSRMSANLFDHFVTDIAGTVESIYGWLGLPLPAAQRAHLADVTARQTTRDRGYDYSAADVNGFDEWAQLIDEVRSCAPSSPTTGFVRLDAGDRQRASSDTP